VFLIEHPKHGGVLFNTGLGPKAKDSSSALGGLSALLGADVSPGPGLKIQLQQAGLKPETIRWIVLSTMQFEHTGALESFPSARVVVAKAEQEYARQAHRGYEPDQFDDVASWKFIDFASAKPLATFPSAVDLFDDGSCVLIDASGSTPGTMALLVRLRDRPLLLADDLAAVEDSLRYAAKPASAYDIEGWWDHIWRLKRFKDLVPDLIVVPGHDVAPARDAHLKEIIVHEVPTPDDAARATPTPDTLHRLLPRPM
jgi:glyoxylase-like metal-dependent hydrolase (beta-lactamase superfamily II)